MPRISIITPVYKIQDFIGATIRSALAQTYTDFEYILVNDQSPDTSVAVIRGIADPRIRLVDNPNKGLPSARNQGLRLSTGEFVALLDGDDLWAPTKLQQQLEYLDLHPTVGAVFSLCRNVNQSGQDMEVGQSLQPEFPSIEELLVRCPIWTPSATLVRRAALDAVRVDDRWFDPEIPVCDDIDMWYRIVSCTHWKFSCIGSVLTGYRIRGGSMCSSLAASREDEVHFLRAWSRMRTYAPHYFHQFERDAFVAFCSGMALRCPVLDSPGDRAFYFWRTAIQHDKTLMWREPSRTLHSFFVTQLYRYLPRSLFWSASDLYRLAARIRRPSSLW